MKQKLKICAHHLRIEGKSLYNPQKSYERREGAGGCIKSEMEKKKDDDDKLEGKMHRGLFTS